MKEINYTGEEVVALTATYLPEEDVIFVKKALDFATEAHKSQFRKSGEPYIVHPIQVAGILAGLKLDAVTVACGFLHDVVEDTDVTLDDMEAEFGPEVRHIVGGVTKLQFGHTADNMANLWSKFSLHIIQGYIRIFNHIM